MKYLLDSNIISYLEDANSSAGDLIYSRLMNVQSDDDVSVSILTLYEFNYGISNIIDESPNDALKLKKSRESLLVRFPLIPLSVQGSELFGLLKTAFRKATGISSKALDRHNYGFHDCEHGFGDWGGFGE